MRFLDSILKVKFIFRYKENLEDTTTGQSVAPYKDHYVYFNAFLNNMEEAFQPKYQISTDMQSNNGQIQGFLQAPARSFNISLNLLPENDEDSYKNFLKIQTIKSFMLSQGEGGIDLAKSLGGDKAAKVAMFGDNDTKRAMSFIHFPPITNSETEKFVLSTFSFKPIDDFGYLVYKLGGGETLIPKAGVLTIGGILDSTRKQMYKVSSAPRNLIKDENFSKDTVIKSPAAATGVVDIPPRAKPKPRRR